VIDVGSSSTKIRVARVDVCVQKLEEMIFEGSEKVSYAADLGNQKKRGADSRFSESIQIQGITAIQKLMKLAKGKTPVERWVGFATSAFRNAQNGSKVLEDYSRQSGIDFRLISQDFEAKLGFIGGIQASQRANSNETLVWDIGGGSQQFVALQSQGQIKVSKIEDAGSDRMRDGILRDIKGISDPKLTSPNPIGKESLKAAEATALELSRRVQLPISKFQEVIGVGGVLSASVTRMTGKSDLYEIGDIQAAVETYSLLSDSEINLRFSTPDPYVESSVSNLILVLGMMKGLGLKRIRVSKYGTTEGALLNPELWTELSKTNQENP